MRTIKLFTTIAVALALLALPIAADARGGHGRHAPRAAGVVRSFQDGVLSIRMAGGRVKSADVTDETDLTCQTPNRARKRVKRVRRRARGRKARAALEINGEDDFGDDSGDDESGEDGTDDLGNDGSEDEGDDSGDDFVQDDNEADGPDDEAPAPRRHAKRRSCSSAALRRGVKVKSAKRSADGTEWAKLVLLRR